MKASELMIMDWVLLDGTPIQVAGLHNRKVGVHKRRRSIYCSWHSDGEFRPIPLTEDILVKNGWRKESITIDGDYANWHGEIPICQEEDEFNYERIELTYVHQLQHLLRLCDIEKEIEL